MTELRPADPGHFFTKVLADQHYQKGREYEQQGDWERALASYRRACAYDPHSVLFLLARGHACQAHGLEAEADECYRAALRLRPNDPVALYNQAQLFAARGALEEARANLARIAASDLEALGERAAPIFCRLGDIALRQEDYTTAEVHFRRALACAPGHRYAQAAYAALPRLAEFRQPFAADGRIAPKVAVYAYGGAMLLGLPEDDGIAIPPYPGLGFDSLDELAQVLARFVAVAREWRWAFDAVVALDAESRPLANALAAAFGARAVAGPEQTPWGACALGVSARGADAVAFVGEAATLRARAGRALCYAVGLREPIWEYGGAVQVASAPVLLEYPWNKGEASAPEHAEAYGVELAARLVQCAQDAPSGDQAAAQAAWYAQHRRLSFDPQTLEPAAPSPLPFTAAQAGP